MGSIVKSIGKAIKKIGKFIKKAAPYILMAVALYAGIAAYGAYTASAAASTAVAGSAAAVAGSTAATTGLNMFSWTNFTTGASAIGSGITGMFSGGGGIQTVGQAGGQTGTNAIAAANIQAGYTGVNVGAVAADPASWIMSAIDGNKGYALLAGSQLLGTGISAIAAAFDDTEEQKLAFAEKQLKQQGTRYGFAPDEGRTPDEMPADSSFWMGYNQNLAMNAGAPVPGKFAHGIRQPTTSNRRTLNYDYSPRGVVTQSAAKTFNQRPTGMININNKPGVLNA